MPLPAALLERLKKRKIIQEESSKSTATADVTATASTVQEASGSSISDSHRLTVGIDLDERDEEIIAEDYSDEEPGSDQEEEDGESDRSAQTDGNEDSDSELHHNTDHDQAASERHHSGPSQFLTTKNGAQSSDDDHEDESSQDAANSSSNPRIISGQFFESVLGCPNKYNVYHVCSHYCHDKYAQPDTDHMAPSKEQRKRLALMLRAFPISNDWTVVYDPGVRTFYFWNIITGHVSWVPPGMSAFASPSANQIRETYLRATGSIQDEPNNQTEAG